MEFYSDGNGNVRYEGLSVFGAEKKGAYSGNVLGEQAYLESFFVENFGDKFQQLKEAVGEAIRQIYGNIYTGYLGVDMLVYRRKTNDEFAIHPCIVSEHALYNGDGRFAHQPKIPGSQRPGRHAHHLHKQTGRSLRTTLLHEKGLST